MEPKAFLDLAANLKDGENEASWRTSVSRSYYALLNLTIRFVKSYFPQNLSGEAKDHDTIYRYLHNCDIEDVELIASTLHDLRTKRNDADYKLDLDRFDENCANIAYMQARSAMEGFEGAIRNAKGRQAIIKGIESYKDKIERPAT
jgi:hypothetical protein